MRVMGSGPGEFLLPSLYSHRRHNKGIGITDLLFYQKGQAMGQCSIQAPDQTCGIHMQEQLHRLGQSQKWDTGTAGYPQPPARVLGPRAPLSPLQQGDRGPGCFPTAGALPLWPEGKTARGIWGLASPQHSAPGRPGTAPPTGRAWPDNQHRAALAGRRSTHLLVPNGAKP